LIRLFRLRTPVRGAPRRFTIIRMSKPQPNLETFTIRLPSDVAKRVDEHAAELQRQVRGAANVSRAGALRDLVVRALDAQRTAR
jgi:hypothetical protein